VCVHRYAADAKRSKAEAEREQKERCTKHKEKQRGLLPGLLVAHCPKCSACLGFHLMVGAVGSWLRVAECC
jgi:hypothetical protein